MLSTRANYDSPSIGFGTSADGTYVELASCAFWDGTGRCTVARGLCSGGLPAFADRMAPSELLARLTQCWTLYLFFRWRL